MMINSLSKFITFLYIIYANNYFLFVDAGACSKSSAVWKSDCTLTSEIKATHSRSISSGTPYKQTAVEAGGNFRFMNIDPHVRNVVVRLTDLRFNRFWTCGGACHGGALYSKDGASLVLTRCHFHSNQAGHTSGGKPTGNMYGGAMYLVNTHLFSLDTIYTNNVATYGAAVYLDGDATYAVFMGQKSEMRGNKGSIGNANALQSANPYYQFVDIDPNKIGSATSYGGRKVHHVNYIYTRWDFLFGPNYGYDKYTHYSHYYSNGGSFYITTPYCDAGSYTHAHSGKDGTGFCSACDIGKYLDKSKKTACLGCDAGKYTDQKGQKKM
jgi:hypothetical protein